MVSLPFRFFNFNENRWCHNVERALQLSQSKDEVVSLMKQKEFSRILQVFFQGIFPVKKGVFPVFISRMTVEIIYL